MMRTLNELDALSAGGNLDRILVTGDMTDAGTRSEWAAFLDLMRKYPALRSRMSFVPGNHDINITDRTNTGRLDLPWSAAQPLRMLRVVLALDEMQGNRTRLVDRASGSAGPLLRNYLRQSDRAERLRELAERGSPRGRTEMTKIWDEIFPLIELPENNHCGLILLNSNARSNYSFSNAIGVVNRGQLRALRSILRNSPGQSWLILLHHHVVEYPVPSVSLTDRIALALVNAPDLLACIAPYAARVAVLHGHRHWDWLGTCGALTVCSAPSTTLSSKGNDGTSGSFRLHEFILGENAGIRLAVSRRVSVA